MAKAAEAAVVLPASHDGALGTLVEPIQDWFRRHFGRTTPAQRLAWPIIQAGEHLLLSAPTGSGKTLAAMLPILSDLWDRRDECGLRCVYVAPLKALVSDIYKNLRQALAELGAEHIRVGCRSGDTNSYQRQKLLDDPPAILLTTPESLALLLCHPDAQQLLGGVWCLIVDEVHSLAGNKRGADLAISLERLAGLTEVEPQRIGLSATIAPLDEVAAWLGGGDRPVRIAAVADSVPIDIQVEHLPEDETGQGFVAALLRRLEPHLQDAATTLIFTNTRGMAERLSWNLRRTFPQWSEQIGTHHSSLAIMNRREVETKLKQGELRIVVSSTSLELGIDIGSVEQVILVNPPGGAGRLLQRIGRSGHGPGRPRRGIVVTSSMPDLLEIVATIGAGQSHLVEPVSVPKHPLDVLCQQLVGMAIQQDWTPAMAFSLIRQAYSFRDLTLSDFVDCLNYLSGGTGDDLPARLRWDEHRFRVRGSRTARIYRANVGTIIDQPGKEVRWEDGRTVGNVGDSFAGQLQPGDRFLLNGRCVELTRSESHELEVREAVGLPAFTRWEGSDWPMHQALAERIWHLRVRAKEALLDGPEQLRQLLAKEYPLADATVTELAAWLIDQETLSTIPTRELLVEVYHDDETQRFVHAFHLPLAAAGADAVGRVLAWRLDKKRHWQVLSGCLGFALIADERIEEDRIREALNPARFAEDLQHAVAATPLIGEKFSEVAHTGLMLLKNPLGKLRRVGGRNWGGRRLFHWLRFADPKFPLLRQATREVQEQHFDVASALACLERIRELPMQIRELPRLSPFAEAWLTATHSVPNRVHSTPSNKSPTEPIFQLTAGPADAAPGIRVNEEWLLTPDRMAMHVPTATAVLADLHLGYDAVRRAVGEAVPERGWEPVRRRLNASLHRYAVRQLLVAGDLVEDARWFGEVERMATWLHLRGIRFGLVPGNHDAGLPRLENLQLLRDGTRLGRWLIVHEPRDLAGLRQVCGHFHPAVRLPGHAAKQPCFLVRENQIILPAFSDDAAGVNVATVSEWRSFDAYTSINGQLQALGRVRELANAQKQSA